MTTETLERTIEDPLVALDRELADIVGLSYEDMDELTQTKVMHLGYVSILGTDEQAAVMRFHCGPQDSIKRGGTKFKWYETEAEQRDDGIDHARAMFYKIGGIDETDYAGGKTIVNVDPHKLTDEQMIDAMKQVATLMDEAELADPKIDGTAGDEGTNGHIDHYVEGLRERGHPHPEACITGKSDMGPRAAATGRGAAIVHREYLRSQGKTQTTIGVQGMGFAGAYYAAEATSPLDPADNDVKIIIPAVGDVKFNEETKQYDKYTLFTDDADGLRITRDMVDSILKNAKEDPDMVAAGGFKLEALARKINRETGRQVFIAKEDVLEFEGVEWVAPAATSNVITTDNIHEISAENWLEIGNHTVHSSAQALMRLLSINLLPGELVNSGGVKMSIRENRRDLARIAAHEAGIQANDPSDAEHEADLRATMVHATRMTLRMAERFGLDIPTAIKAVGLANYAMSRSMRISEEVRSLFALAA